MGRMATKEELEEYLENGLCPYCFAEDVVEDGSETEGEITRIAKYCTKCELRWTEIWEDGALTGLFLTDGD